MPTVLVVEDEPMLRASMVRGLSKLSGVSVLAAGSVDEARAIISATVPQLLITDLNLPDRSGLEVIAELDRLGARIPIVVASAYLRRFKLPSRPGMIVLEKPVALANLREVVVEHLGLKDVSAPFSLADYVQLAGMGRRSVRLDVAQAGKRLGEVIIHHGEAWHARDEQGVGPEAFSRLVGLTGATVSAHPVIGEPTRSLSGSCEALLLDSLRRQDESRSHEESDEISFNELGRVVSTPRPPPRAATRPAVPPRSAGRPLTPTPPPSTTSSPSAAFKSDQPPVSKVPDTLPPKPVTSSLTFDALYARGVEALLDRRYKEAYESFESASRVGTSASLTANLARLRAMGFGS